tara:strand:- start:1386 stop:1649 length:264 start_codon:yes stop_codon:yes gene_type:complete
LVDGFVEALLRGHVLWCADQPFGDVRGVFCEGVSDAKVDHLCEEWDVRSSDDLDVFGFEIAVDDAFSVGGDDPHTDLVEEGEGDVGT